MNRLWTGVLALLLGMGQTACAQSGTEKQTDMKDKKVLVAFFSRADENYGVGYIEKGSTPRNVAKACKGATILNGLAIQGTTAQRQTSRAKSSVDNWLKKTGF